MLESFVKAAVTAIDQRDPTTAGHSLRVATLSTSLAEAVGREHRGEPAQMHFSRKQMRELRFAALLHDFGKVAVREELLVKAKKLPRVLWERVSARFDVIHRTLELEACRRGGDDRSSKEADAIMELARMRELVSMANEPSIVDQVPPAQLREIAKRTFHQPDGKEMPYLTVEELHYLQLCRGTLDDVERAEIQAHVEETYQFLVKIPWTDDLRNVANFAYCHHEKLNGSGYPHRLDAAEIPLQARIITIADIFDALTAADRPYKPALPVGGALEILQQEAAAGLLDRQLVDIMVESRSYQRVLQDDWRSL
jgi:HD-GYP domain-containing protein (c-di-GMP phosphodiesterase class II)